MKMKKSKKDILKENMVMKKKKKNRCQMKKWMDINSKITTVKIMVIIQIIIKNMKKTATKNNKRTSITTITISTSTISKPNKNF